MSYADLSEERKEQMRAASRRWHERNREKMNARDREYYRENRSYILAQKKRRREGPEAEAIRAAKRKRDARYRQIARMEIAAIEQEIEDREGRRRRAKILNLISEREYLRIPYPRENRRPPKEDEKFEKIEVDGIIGIRQPMRYAPNITRRYEGHCPQITVMERIAEGKAKDEVAPAMSASERARQSAIARWKKRATLCTTERRSDALLD